MSPFSRGRRPGARAVSPRASFRFIDSSTEFAEMLAAAADAPSYAIDTEFHRERTYYPRLALVQVAFGEQICLLDPLALDVEPLAKILAGPGLALFHACDQDLEVLERSCGTRPAHLFDTQVAAGFLGFSTPSLSTLVERILGETLEKGDQLTDWTRRPLEDAQLAYAANDVAYLHLLYERLIADLDRRGRLEWALEECELIRVRPRGAGDPDEAWWRLKQSRQLRGPARGVAQCVAAWRERRAQELDLPPRFVLSDLALVALAQRPPRTRAELEAVRGLDVRQLQGVVGEALLAAIESGRNLPTSALHLPPRPQGEPAAKPAVGFAAAWVSERARELEIDPAILATRADLAAFLSEPPSGRLANSWRHSLIGEPIRRLIAGDASLALSGGTVVLEERSHLPLRASTEHPTVS